MSSNKPFVLIATTCLVIIHIHTQVAVLIPCLQINPLSFVLIQNLRIYASACKQPIVTITICCCCFLQNQFPLNYWINVAVWALPLPHIIVQCTLDPSCRTNLFHFVLIQSLRINISACAFILISCCYCKQTTTCLLYGFQAIELNRINVAFAGCALPIVTFIICCLSANQLTFCINSKTSN